MTTSLASGSSAMNESKWELKKLDVLIRENKIELGRGNIISRIDIDQRPGPYPIYSSSAHNNGKFGEYGDFMFEEELVTWSVDGGGNFFYRPKHKFSVTNVCGYLRVKDQSISARFIFYVLCKQHEKLTFDYTSKAHPSVIKKLYNIPVLPLTVQQKIANILQTIDEAVEKNEQLIEKYQQIKAGLMHDLFTRGIGTDGKLRPPREQAPELYWESPIGWIPKDWDLSTCDSVCERVIDCKNRTPPITPDGFPVIRTPNVRNGEFIDSDLVFTDASSYEIWTARGKPKPGDIVITREAPVGEVCKIPERHMFACLGQRMMLYRPDVEKIDIDFFLYALQSSSIQERLDLISGGSTVGHVRVGDIRSLWMFVPQSLGEQQRISKMLGSVIDRLSSERETLTKLKNQKSGLMHDLLTGKVPVSADLPVKPASPEEGAA
ncbi:MAG: restriction endonuclease subunit S [Pseudomonadota bacterium]|nr:restriction endonuclease subunit S [Pseudomonadota bacterium]